MSRRLLLCVLTAATMICGQAAASSWTLFSTPTAAANTAVGRGQAVFQGRCEICHGQGNDRAGTISLQMKYQGSKPALLEQRTDLAPDAVRFFVRHGVAMMPPFRKTELSDPELDDLAAYLARKR